jgi:glutamine amidotransferase-like uncharacterized protein
MIIQEAAVPFALRYCILILLLLAASRQSKADDARAPSRPIRVAVYDDTGVGRSLQELVHVLDGLSGVRYDRIQAENIRKDRLADYDVLIHPGGSGSKQAKGLGEAGRAKARRFVENGGGYVGICAGAYLATSDYPWSLHILDAKVLDKAHWARGHGEVQVRLTDKGKEFLETDDDALTIYYYQGPLLAPANDPGVPDYDTLARFETEIAENGAPKGVMKGTTAIAAGIFGRGRVVCFSPHPEKTEGLDRFVDLAIRWTAGKGVREANAERRKRPRRPSAGGE